MGQGKEIILTMNINIFMQNYLNINAQFLTNMHGTLSSIITYLRRQGFDQEDSEERQKERDLNKLLRIIETRIDNMKYTPTEYIRGTALINSFKKDELKKLPKLHLSEIEWIAYRETHYKTKLKRKYEAAKGWRNQENTLYFSDVLKIAAQIKQDLYNSLIELLEELNLENIQITIPQLQPEKTESVQTWQK